MVSRDLPGATTARAILFSLVALVAFLLAAPAMAQGSCDDRTSVLETLARKYQEAPIAAGITSSGGLVEVLSDGTGGTWTIIITSPQGLSCLVAAGEGWRSVHEVEEGSGI